MRKFKFVSDYARIYKTNISSLKKVEYRTLPNIFSFDDLEARTKFDIPEPTMFSKSILKRMKNARHGTIIRLSEYSRIMLLGLLVIDTDEAKEKRNKISRLKHQITKLAKNQDVRSYFAAVEEFYKLEQTDKVVAFLKELK